MVPALDSLYIMGSCEGMPGEDRRVLCLCYNIASDTWTEQSRPPSLGTVRMAVFLETKGEIYYFIPASYTARIQIYSIAADTRREIKYTLPDTYFINLYNALCFTV
jgi:hypothetical protein